mgnify:CR=1 FL=1
MSEQPDEDGFVEEAAEAEAEDTQEVEAEEAEADEVDADEVDDAEEGDDDEAKEAEEVEAELFELTLDDGTKVEVPQSAKDAFMKNADYTQKTQSLSEQRKALEADRQRFQQAIKMQTQFTEADSNVRVIDSQLAQYEGIDWNTWGQQDPASAQQAQIQLGALREQRGQAVQELQKLQAEAQQTESREIARQTEENRQKVATAVADWSSDTERAIFDYGLKSGLSESQLASTNYDPAVLSILNKARLFDELQQRQTAKPKKKKAEPVPKAEKVRAKKSSSRSAPTDSDSTEAWLKKRNAQIAKRMAG